MTDSLMPSARSGGNKGVILLLVGGFVLLGITGVVFFLKQTGADAPAPPPASIEPALAVPEPLIKQVEEKPLALMPPDSEPEEDTGEEEKPGRKAPERMGTIDPKEVKTFMNAHFSEVKACYERRLKTNSMLEGKLDLNISVSSSGKVKAVTVNQNTVRDRDMLACVRRTIFGWRFPKPKGGHVVIAKTFNFKKKV